MMTSIPSLPSSLAEEGRNPTQFPSSTVASSSTPEEEIDTAIPSLPPPPQTPPPPPTTTTSTVVTSSPTTAETSEPTNIPSAAATTTPNAPTTTSTIGTTTTLPTGTDGTERIRYDYLVELFTNYYQVNQYYPIPFGDDNIFDVTTTTTTPIGSPQHLALSWLAKDDPQQLPIEMYRTDTFGKIQAQTDVDDKDDHHALLIKNQTYLIERYLLVTFYYAQEDVNWMNFANQGNWLSGVSHCQWIRIYCEDNRYLSQDRRPNDPVVTQDIVRDIAFPYLHFNIILISEITMLPNLENFDITWNTIVNGTIPKTIHRLSNLKGLYFRAANLSTTIPTTIIQLTKLQNLDLHNNQLHGTLPPIVPNTTRSMNLVQNQLTGTMPTTYGYLTLLEYIWWDHNHELRGSIPSEIGLLTKLKELYFRNCSFSGTMPTELGQLTELWTMELSNNQLNGTIPSELGNLSNLQRLNLYNNFFTGTIPTELEQLQPLQMFNLQNNSFTDGTTN